MRFELVVNVHLRMLFCLLFCVCFGRHMASAQLWDIKGQTGTFLHKVINNCFLLVLHMKRNMLKKVVFNTVLTRKRHFCNFRIAIL